MALSFGIHKQVVFSTTFCYIVEGHSPVWTMHQREIPTHRISCLPSEIFRCGCRPPPRSGGLFLFAINGSVCIPNCRGGVESENIESWYFRHKTPCLQEPRMILCRKSKETRVFTQKKISVLFSQKQNKCFLVVCFRLKMCKIDLGEIQHILGRKYTKTP